MNGILDGGFWDFTADLAHGDTAYTNLALKAHTDNTYFVSPSIHQCCLPLSHFIPPPLIGRQLILNISISSGSDR